MCLVLLHITGEGRDEEEHSFRMRLDAMGAEFVTFTNYRHAQGKIVFIDPLVTKPTQGILRDIGASNSALVRLRKARGQ